MKLDKFVIAIIATILLAYFFPQLGYGKYALPLDEIGSIGISLIFFFYGLKLSPEKIRSGLANWKLHVVVQLSTFLAFPLVVLLFFPFAKTEQLHALWLAVFFMAVLPSTVSSSVVMVSLAKGNVPAAIFNASISGLIGIVITPLWMGFFIHSSGQEFDFTAIYTKLLLEILLPVVLGLSLQKFGHSYAQKYSKQLSFFDKSIILVIIFKSFSESFEKHVFSSLDPLILFGLFAVVILLFFVVYFLIGWISRLLKFNREDRITTQFCGTKKSLVHGTVFSKVIFAGMPFAGIMLLPLMIFHAWQILIISVIATKKAKEVKQEVY